MSKPKRRGLSGPFVADLCSATGQLRWLLDEVQRDRSLCLEIRRDYINVYYRGGNLVKLKPTKRPAGYTGEFDDNYFRDTSSKPTLKPRDVGSWLPEFPALKRAMDRFINGELSNSRTARGKAERECQQRIVSASRWAAPREGAYFICDQEYATGRAQSRFDMVAARWSDGGRWLESALTIIELKYGDLALDRGSSIEKHLCDVEQFLSSADRHASFVEEMACVVDQHRRLGLAPAACEQPSFRAVGEVLVLVVEHNERSIVLKRAIEASIPQIGKLEKRGLRVSFAHVAARQADDFSRHVVDWRQFLEQIGRER